MRLWSTVVSQDVKRPSRQSAWKLWTSVLAAIRLRLDRLGVRDQRVDLLVGPVASDRRHLPDAVAEDRGDSLAVVQQRIPAERGTDVALVDAVARGADVVELLLAED